MGLDTRTVLMLLFAGDDGKDNDDYIDADQDQGAKNAMG